MASTPEPAPSEVTTAQLVPERRPPARRRSWGWLVVLLTMGAAFASILFLVVGTLASALGPAGEGPIEEKFHSHSTTATDKIAIITVEGTILDGDGFVKKQIDQVRGDANVKAIVLRVVSPGGTVTGSDYIYHHLSKLVQDRKLPLVVSMGGIAASGGYYVSMAVGDTKDSIFAEPTTWTGSVGVIIPHYNLSGLMQRFEVEEDSIKSHRLKQMGSFTRPMTDEERAIFQGLVDDSFGRFKEIVKAGRPAFRGHDELLNKVATGQVFTTHQALANGLVDKEGFIEDAIDRAIDLAALDKTNVRVVKYKHPFGLFDGLIGMQAKHQPPDLAAILDAASPRAYYLCTWLPGTTSGN